MLVLRKYLVFAIDASILIWLLKVVAFDENSDVIGILIFTTLGVLAIYNSYAFLLYRFFFKNEKHKLYLEVLYFLLLVLPLFSLWYFT